MPSEKEDPYMWHEQFRSPQGDEAREGAVTTILRKGSHSRTHLGQVAIVFGLAELFHDLGEERTAADLYEVYISARIFAHVRAKTPRPGRWQRWQQGW